MQYVTQKPSFFGSGVIGGFNSFAKILKMRVLVRIAALALLMYVSACSPNNVKVDKDLKVYFDSNHVNGTFGLLNNGLGEFTVYNLSRFKDSAFLPASTFNIVSSLVGVETGRIRNESMVIKWDGVARLLPNGDTARDWNKDLTMQEALSASSVPYYQEVARRIGKDTMQRWIDSLGYGARFGKAHIKTAVDTFWLDNTVKVTADEQLGLVKKLYFGQLPFQKRTQDIVKKVMLQESNAKYKISYNTGWGLAENGDAMGWTLGWLEENNHVYFFSLNLEGPKSTDMAKARMTVLNSILKNLGFFEGKM